MDESRSAWIRVLGLRGPAGSWCPGAKEVPRLASSLFAFLEAGADGAADEEDDGGGDDGEEEEDKEVEGDGEVPTTPVPTPTPPEGAGAGEIALFCSTGSLCPSPVQSLLYSLPWGALTAGRSFLGVGEEAVSG